jgi:adenylylsulfate kinase
MPIFQLTGLSGAGKTTLASRVMELLLEQDIAAEIIDGDVYRKTLCNDLGFSKEDRLENIRRLGAVANGISMLNKVAIIAAINPYEQARKGLEEQYNARTVFINCSLHILQQRDTKGLYKKAALPDGHPDKVQLLTGVSDVYEIPSCPHLVIDTGNETLEFSTQKLFDFIYKEMGL